LSHVSASLTPVPHQHRGRSDQVVCLSSCLRLRCPSNLFFLPSAGTPEAKNSRDCFNKALPCFFFLSSLCPYPRFRARDMVLPAMGFSPSHGPSRVNHRASRTCPRARGAANVHVVASSNCRPRRVATTLLAPTLLRHAQRDRSRRWSRTAALGRDSSRATAGHL